MGGALKALNNRKDAVFAGAEGSRWGTGSSGAPVGGGGQGRGGDQ